MFNQRDLQATDERRKDLRREVERERLAKQARQTEHKASSKKSPLWTRVWILFL